MIFLCFSYVSSMWALMLTCGESLLSFPCVWVSHGGASSCSVRLEGIRRATDDVAKYVNGIGNDFSRGSSISLQIRSGIK